MSDRKKEIIDRLRRVLDDIDAQTRREGEPPLRKEVARQARERLTEHDRDR